MVRFHICRTLVLLGVVATRLAWAADLAEGSCKFFRYDQGVAASAAGPLPDNFDAPGALDWRVEIDSGHSTPILWSQRIFLTTYRAAAAELATVAIEAGTGQVLWRQVAPASKIETHHPRNGNPATPTPACDGQRLYVFFGSCGLLCYDLDGHRLWAHRLGPFQDEYGAGSSPVLIGDKVVLNQDHDIDSFLLALKRADGQVAWQTPRPDAVRSYATPAVWARTGRPELLVAGALELAGYDPANGQRLWWTGGLARIVIPTPLPAGERVYMASWAPGGDPGRRLALEAWPVALSKWDKNGDGKLARSEVEDPEVLDRFYRMDLDQSGDLNPQEWERHREVFRRAQNAMLALKPRGTGQLGEDAVVWKCQRGIPYVATPLLDQGLLWMIKDGGIVTKLDAASGQVLQEERLPALGAYYASPVAGDGKVYFASESGVVTVVANQRPWQIIASHDFKERIYATPVPESGHLYLRTEKALYCFRGKAAPEARASGSVR